MRSVQRGAGLRAWGRKALTVAVLAALAGPAHAQPAPAAPASESAAPGDKAAEARAHHEAGMAHYAARAFAAAARAFATAYALDPRRESLFAQAQATRLAGDCPGATRLYEAFLATAPPPQQIEATHLALARCAPPPLSPSPPASPSPTLTSRPPPPSSQPPLWWHDRPGQLLAGSAALALATAGGFLAAAHHANGDVGTGANYQQYEPRRVIAEDRARWAGRVALAGLALAAGAGARFLWVRFGAGSGSAGVEGRF